MFSRSTLKGIARLALATLLFAQAALAFAGCDWLRAAPALAISASSSQLPCHEEPAVNANLCLAHCLGEDQSLDKPVVKVPAFFIAPILLVPAVSVSPDQARVPQRRAAPRAAGPPLRILFQSLLI